MKNYGRKICPKCKCKLIKKGYTNSNKQIWYCKHCKKSFVFKRKDIQDKLWFKLYNLGKLGEQNET